MEAHQGITNGRKNKKRTSPNSFQDLKSTKEDRMTEVINRTLAEAGIDLIDPVDTPMMPVEAIHHYYRKPGGCERR